MLADFQCRYGQTQHILIKGEDDNFKFGNAEPSRRITKLKDYPGHVTNYPYLRDYDDTSQDKAFTDFFEVPENVSRGLFVIRLAELDDYGSDSISLLDLPTTISDNILSFRHSFNSYVNDLGDHSGWHRSAGNVYTARLRDIRFQYNDLEYEPWVERQYDDLLTYIQSLGRDMTLDVLIAEDTGVDFMGLALCTEPPEAMGVTFAEFKFSDQPKADFQLLSCDLDYDTPRCNPFTGDTLCSTALPLACFIDTGEPVPQMKDDVSLLTRQYIQTYWSGGHIKVTPAMRGDHFKTLAEANQYCAAEFGDGWRVLDYHDGGFKGVAAHRLQDMPDSAVWVDIKDQPKGTCWARDDKATRLNVDRP